MKRNVKSILATNLLAAALIFGLSYDNVLYALSGLFAPAAASVQNDAGSQVDPNGGTQTNAATSGSTGDRGWGIDPNGSRTNTTTSGSTGDRGWGIDPNGQK